MPVLNTYLHLFLAVCFFVLFLCTTWVQLILGTWGILLVILLPVPGERHWK